MPRLPVTNAVLIDDNEQWKSQLLVAPQNHGDYFRFCFKQTTTTAALTLGQTGSLDSEQRAL